MITMGEARFSLSRNEIVRMKIRALRAGVWYKVLTRIERACIDLVIGVVDRVRSRLLARVLSAVLSKLEESVESRLPLLMREVGRRLASNLSRIAQGWGCRSAESWVEEAGFVQYLTITYMNGSGEDGRVRSRCLV